MSYKANIESLTLANKNYRKVLYTNKQQQLVLMNILPHEEIGMEKHIHNSQFIRVEHGNGIAIVDNHRYRLSNGSVIIIPNNTMHNIIAGNTGLKLYTIYSPPVHADKLIERYKTIES